MLTKTDYNTCASEQKRQQRAARLCADLLAKHGPLSEQGTIKGPGKFELEPLYVAHFYDAAIEGSGEEIYATDPEHYSLEPGSELPDDLELDLICTEFKIDAFDCEYFPELEKYHGQYIRIFEDDYGFVSHTINEKRWYDE